MIAAPWIRYLFHLQNWHFDFTRKMCSLWPMTAHQELLAFRNSINVLIWKYYIKCVCLCQRKSLLCYPPENVEHTKKSFYECFGVCNGRIYKLVLCETGFRCTLCFSFFKQQQQLHKKTNQNARRLTSYPNCSSTRSLYWV